MLTEFQGPLSSAPGRFAVVVSRYNETITSKLLAGALDTLRAHGVADEAMDVAWTPGAFEIPLAAQAMAATGKYAAVLCLGAVIRGDTTHDQHINRAVSLAIMRIGLKHRLPVLFGVLTCDNLEQAIHRAGGRQGNKGAECAEAALRMVNLLDEIDGGGESY
ncbi:MAG: 6,7-dimethyl-8-ribityllumazine synthase [Planctomycetota bacterium]|nr:MAG: 6,7-dimethyl-8-ribityllumazine synthase [Planctomycetota bacterium]